MTIRSSLAAIPPGAARNAASSSVARMRSSCPTIGASASTRSAKSVEPQQPRRPGGRRDPFRDDRAPSGNRPRQAQFVVQSQAPRCLRDEVADTLHRSAARGRHGRARSRATRVGVGSEVGTARSSAASANRVSVAPWSRRSRRPRRTLPTRSRARATRRRGPRGPWSSRRPAGARRCVAPGGRAGRGPAH